MGNKTEAVIICVNYSDFLSITLQYNLKQFDHVIIVTSHSDNDTVNICSKYNCTLIKTNSFYENGNKFNKGAGINVAFKYLKYKNWVAHMDSDIILCDHFMNDFLNQQNDIEYLYGCRRYDFPKPEDWNDLVSGNRKLNEYTCYRGSGYGYFQLWNYNSKIFQNLMTSTDNNPYPNWINSAAESDSIFMKKWGERCCPLNAGNHLIDEGDYDAGMYKELSQRCYHLGQHGINHTGRVTQEFKIL